MKSAIEFLKEFLRRSQGASFRVLILLLLFFSSSCGPRRNEVGGLENSGVVEKGTVIQGRGVSPLLGT